MWLFWYIIIIITLLPVVELHLLHLPLLKATGEVSGSAQDVFHIQEELLLDEKETKQQII